MADQWDTIDGYNLSQLADEARLDADDRAAGAGGTEASASRPAPTPPPDAPSTPNNGGGEPVGLGRFAQRLQGQRIPATGGGVVARVSNLPMPGGIGMLVFALVVFLFIIAPVNGTKTRMELIWLVITGAYKLPSNDNAIQAAENAAAVVDASTTGIAAAGNAIGVPLPQVTGANAYSVGAAIAQGINIDFAGAGLPFRVG